MHTINKIMVLRVSNIFSLFFLFFLIIQLRGVDPPALMAVGVVKASCASVFELVMALGDSRAE